MSPCVVSIKEAVTWNIRTGCCRPRGLCCPEKPVLLCLCLSLMPRRLHNMFHFPATLRNLLRLLKFPPLPPTPRPVAHREVHVHRALKRRSPKQTCGFVKLLSALKASGQLFRLFLSQTIRGHLLRVPKPNRVRQGISQSPLSLGCLGPNPIRDLDWWPTLLMTFPTELEF